MSPEEFYASYYPFAESVSERTGVDPRLVLAQAALETGYGRSAPGNNFFGIKSHGRAGGQDLMTTEVEGGETVRKRQSFRGYDDPSESFSDYADFLLENPRYRDVLQAESLPEQIEEMGRSGYATDPDYATKLSQIAGRFTGAAPEMTDAARRAQYGLGDRGAGNTVDVMDAVRRGDMTKSEAGRYVSEELLEGIEGGSAYDILKSEEDSFLDKLGAAAGALKKSGLMAAPEQPDFNNLPTDIYRGRPNTGSRALQRMGIASLA